MADRFTYDVFLSHSSKDKPRVRALAKKLRDAGLRVWFDEWVIGPGDVIYLAIERGLEETRVQVLCLSPAALTSDWVTLERSTAIFRDPSNAGRRFIPLLLADCELPDALRCYKYVDYRRKTKAAFEKLLAVCRPETESALHAPVVELAEEHAQPPEQAEPRAVLGRKLMRHEGSDERRPKYFPREWHEAGSIKSPKTRLSTLSNPIANFDPEREAFKALLSPGSAKRILLFQGASGSGKTTLLNHCIELIPESACCVPIHFRETAAGIAEIFVRTGNSLGWDHFPVFTRTVERLIEGTRVSRNWLLGIENRIHAAMYAEDSGKREERRVALTRSWFADLRSLAKPLLIVFDTYERATTEVQDWVEGPFLASVVQIEHLRILLAGQVVPKIENMECCSLRNLLGVPEAEHWMPVVRDMKRTIAVDDPFSWLVDVCHVLKGSPRDIMQIIERLPRENEQ